MYRVVALNSMGYAMITSYEVKSLYPSQDNENKYIY